MNDLPNEPGFLPPTHPRVQLVPTAQGIRAFEIAFSASLPNNLALCLDHALDAEPYALEPVDARILALHRHIHRALVTCMPNDRPDLLLQMVAESGKLGPRNIVWLRNKLDPKHVGNNVKTVLDIFSGTIGVDIHAQVRSVETIIAKARVLEGAFKISDVLLALVIIYKLPSTSKLRHDLVTKDPLPTPASILLLLQQTAAFADDDDMSSDHGGLKSSTIMSGVKQRRQPCYNCGLIGHDNYACEKPKADCDICGAGAGHINAFCLAQTKRDIPASINEASRKKILANRARFFAAKGEAAAATLPTHDDENELLAWLDEELAGGPGACLECE